MTRSQRAALAPMHEGRADVIGGGAIVVEELARELRNRAGIDELTVSEHDILDGIALSLARISHIRHTRPWRQGSVLFVHLTATTQLMSYRCARVRLCANFTELSFGMC